MRKTLALTLCVCLLVSLCHGFSWKKVFKDTKNFTENVAKSVEKGAKSAVDKSGDIAKDIKDKVVSAVEKSANEIKNTAENVKKGVQGVSPEQVQQLKEQAVTEVVEKLKEEAMKNVRTSISEQLTEAFKNGQISWDGNSKLPETIKTIFQDPAFAEKLKNWNLKKDLSEISANLIKEHPEIKQQLDQSTIELKKLAVEDKLTQEAIRKFVEEFKTKMDQVLPSKEQIQATLDKAMVIEQQAELQLKDFDMAQFQEKMKSLVDNYKTELLNANGNLLLTSQEKQEFLSYIVASNEKLNALFKNIDNKVIKDRLINRMKNIVDKSLDGEAPSYDNIMSSLNTHTTQIETAQSTHIKDSSIVLQSPVSLKPREQFTFSIEDIMAEKRADIDFFEFVSMSLMPGQLPNPLHNEYSFVVATPDRVTGIAPPSEGVYTYQTTLKYTSFKDGGDVKIIDSDFKLFVGVRLVRKQDSELKNTAFIVVICFLASLTIGVIFFAIYNTVWKGKKTYTHAEVDQADELPNISGNSYGA